MDLTDNSKKSLDNLYSKYMQFTGVMLEEYDAMEIAAIMAAQAFSLYRTCMSEEDYQRMTQTIYNNRNEVKTFG
jgi:hypothetical protein